MEYCILVEYYTCGIINTDKFVMSMYHKIGVFVKKHTEGKEKEREKNGGERHTQDYTEINTCT